MKIGAIDIPYVRDIDKPKNRPVELVWGAGLPGPIPFEDIAEPEKVTITGTCVKNATYTKTLNQQIEDLLALSELGVSFNSVNVTDLKGFLSVSGVKPKVSASKVGLWEVTLDAWFYSTAQYRRNYSSNPVIITNDYLIVFGSDGANNLVAIPIGAKYIGGDGAATSRASKDGAITLVKANTNTDIGIELTADEINIGECQAFDSVVADDTNENNWVRIFNKDHVFSGDCIIENGLVRLKINLEQDTSIKGYCRDTTGNTWIYSGQIEWGLTNIGSANSTRVILITSNPDKIVVETQFDVTISGTPYNNAAAIQYTIQRGAYTIFEYIKSVRDVGATDYRNTVYTQPIVARFGIDGDYSLGDYTLADYNNQGATDNYGIFIDPTTKIIHIRGSAKKYNGANGINIRYSTVVPNSQSYNPMSLGQAQSGLKYFMGWVYGSWIANLFKECEAMVQGSGVTFYTGVDASPKTGNTGSTMNVQYESIDYTQPASNLGHGATGNSTYKLFARAKDSAQTANDLRIRVQNTTDGTTLANVTKTLTSSWAYYPVDITLGNTDNPTDNINVFLSKDTASANTIDLDYVLWVPVSLDNYNGPKDIAHQALVSSGLVRELIQR